MRQIRFSLVAVIVLGAVGVHAQVDSAFVDNPNRGTIKVRKPGKAAFCKVQADYFVYTSENEGPKIGKLKNGLIYFKKDNKLKNDGDPGNPKPVFGNTEMKSDLMSVYSDAGLSAFFTDTIHYSYDQGSDKYDTIQLKVFIDRKGNYFYSYGTKQDSLSVVGQKCMEALTCIKYWSPAYTTKIRKAKKNKQGLLRKRNAYAQVILTIVVSSNYIENSDMDIFQLSEKEGKQ